MAAIDSEFQSLIPPLTDDEYERLERSILSEGVRHPIVTWNNTIIDGHNRYNICEEHGIKCPQVERQFESRDAAKLWIIDNQLRRRNLPPAAIGDLKLEEKEILTRRAKERSLANLKRGTVKPDTPNLGERESKHDGETLEQLARDISIGRESLRKLDVIKQRAKGGDPVAIEERQALISGEKKSIHGAYVRVVGKQQRKPEETTAEDGRKICAMCGEPIDPGDAHSSRPTVHKKCEVEYQRDWKRERRSKPKTSDDGRRICAICGEPIDEGDHYQDKLNWHYGCGLAHATDMQRRYRDADHDLRNNVATYTIDSLVAEMSASVEDMREAITESISINEGMGVRISEAQKRRIDKAIENVMKAVRSIGGE